MRLSFAGSSGWFGSTWSSRRPLPLVSITIGVQPCEAASSPVSSNFFVSSQPITPDPGPPALVHSVLLASSANIRWCVGKQVRMSVILPVFGSSIERWRVELASGNTLADGCAEPCLQKSGLGGGPTREVHHTRPLSSYIGLCVVVWPCQIGSSPQYGDGDSGSSLKLCAFGSRIGIWNDVAR